MSEFKNPIVGRGSFVFSDKVAVMMPLVHAGMAPLTQAGTVVVTHVETAPLIQAGAILVAHAGTAPLTQAGTVGVAHAGGPLVDQKNIFLNIDSEIEYTCRPTSAYRRSAKQLEQKNPEVIIYAINSDEWVTEEIIPSRILEVNNETVTLECLVNAENKEFENRVFDRKLLEGVTDIQLDQLVEVKISTKKGEIRFSFLNGKDKIDPTLFEEPDYFQELKEDYALESYK